MLGDDKVHMRIAGSKSPYLVRPFFPEQDSFLYFEQGLHVLQQRMTTASDIYNQK